MSNDIAVGGSIWTVTKADARINQLGDAWYRDYNFTAEGRAPVVLRFQETPAPSLADLTGALASHLKIPELGSRVIYVHFFSQEGVLRVEENQARQHGEGTYKARLSLTLDDGTRRERVITYNREAFATQERIEAAVRKIGPQFADDTPEPFQLRS